MKKLLVAVLVLFATVTASASDIDAVREQFVGYSTASGAARSSTRMTEALGALEASARAAQNALGADGSWPDINYNETPSGSWGPWSHTQRLWILAKAYQTPGQSLYHDAALLTDINAALAYT